jgi:hypothetical protein
LLACLFFIGALAGLYFQFAYHKFLNNDTLSYINLAERYAAGDWQHALNGFWSPLYCWILCLCKLAGLPLLQSCYVINFIVAGMGLYVLCRLARRYLTQPLFYYTFSLYTLLLLLFYAMSSLTPDLMAAVYCLWFLLLVTDQRFQFNKQLPWQAGIAAACAFFAKLYCFVPIHLFLGSWLLLMLIKYKSTQSKYLVPLIKTYGLFILLSSCWVALLSIHEGKLVITTAGPFNHNFMSPDFGKGYSTDGSIWAPPFENTYALPFEKAYSPHTDPAHLLDGYSWSPFSNSQNFHHQLALIKTSINDLIRNLDPTKAKWLVLILSLLILLFNSKKLRAYTYDKSIQKIAWFFIVYPLLYLPLFILDRYILTCIICFHLLLFFIAQLAWHCMNKKIFAPVIAVLLLVSIVPFIIQGQRKLNRSSGEYQYYKSFYQHVPELSFLKEQNIATERYAIVEGTQLCYYLHCRTFGTWTDKQYQSLKRFNIRFLLSKNDLSAFPFLHIKKKMLLEEVAFYVYEVE